MRHCLIHNQILAGLHLYNVSFDRFIGELYINKEMSAPEIVEYIKQNTNRDISTRSIQRILAKKKLTRDTKSAFALAISRGRVQWKYKEFKYKRRKLNTKLRYTVLQRDQFKCLQCGNTAKNALLEIDHIIPICKGGLSIIDNLQTLCHLCNKGKQITNKEI